MDIGQLQAAAQHGAMPQDGEAAPAGTTLELQTPVLATADLPPAGASPAGDLQRRIDHAARTGLGTRRGERIRGIAGLLAVIGASAAGWAGVFWLAALLRG